MDAAEARHKADIDNMMARIEKLAAQVVVVKKECQEQIAAADEKHKTDMAAAEQRHQEQRAAILTAVTVFRKAAARYFSLIRFSDVDSTPLHAGPQKFSANCSINTQKAT